MNEKLAKKVRKEARELWREYLIKSDKLPFRDRWQIGWRIINWKGIFSKKRK